MTTDLLSAACTDDSGRLGKPPASAPRQHLCALFSGLGKASAPVTCNRYGDIMTIEEIKERPEGLIGCLLLIWESSVAATHDFLSNQDIIMLRPYVLEGLRKVPVLLVATEDDRPAAFLGMHDDMVDMLFVDASCRGRGLGGDLLYEALRRGAHRVDVNEQNTQAVGFYIHAGFEVSGRSATDALGLPFPVLHMKRS